MPSLFSDNIQKAAFIILTDKIFRIIVGLFESYFQVTLELLAETE